MQGVAKKGSGNLEECPSIIRETGGKREKSVKLHRAT